MRRHFFRNLILRMLTPIQKVMQKIGKPEPKIKGNFVMKLIPMLEDGDLLLSREDWRLTNPFVPGFWAVHKVAKSIRLVGAVTPQDLFEHKLLKTLLNSCERK